MSSKFAKNIAWHHSNNIVDGVMMLYFDSEA
jgi:hypothetical protein